MTLSVHQNQNLDAARLAVTSSHSQNSNFDFPQLAIATIVSQNTDKVPPFEDDVENPSNEASGSLSFEPQDSSDDNTDKSSKDLSDEEKRRREGSTSSENSDGAISNRKMYQVINTHVSALDISRTHCKVNLKHEIIET